MLRKKNNSNLAKGARCVPIGASLALLLVLFIALCPIAVDKTQATDDGGIATFSGWLSSSVTLTMADSVSETIEPTVAGAFKNLATVAHVEVNNSDYYEVSMHASSKDMTNTAAGSDSTAKIGSITTAGTSSSFNSNQWGYNLTKNGAGVTTAVPATSTTEYQPVATTATAMPGIGKQATTNNAASDYYTMNFGAKVDTSIPAGIYSSTVTLSVVASPKQVTGFDRTDTMQGMTASICKEIGSELDIQSGGAAKYAATDSLGNTYYTKRLKDLRDGKSYWVAKLADGNCWMTQNLALDIPAEGLTSELTALAPGKTSWKPEEATRVVANMTEEEKAERFVTKDCSGLTGNAFTLCKVNNSKYSWDEGNYVVVYPAGGNEELYTGFNEEEGGINGFAELKLTDYFTISNTNGIDISNYGVAQDVSGKDWVVTNEQNFTESNVFVGSDGKTYSKVPGLSIAIADNGNQKMYDAHYLTGNYYQWPAATAQTMEESQENENNQRIEGSICPKGWVLPTSGAAYNETDGSFYNVLKAYVGSSLKTGGTQNGENIDANNGNNLLDEQVGVPNGLKITLGDFLTGSPFRLSRVGSVYMEEYHEFRDLGGYGLLWSSVASSSSINSTNAYSYGMYVPYVNASRSHAKYLSFPIRCLINTAE